MSWPPLGSKTPPVMNVIIASGLTTTKSDPTLTPMSNSPLPLYLVHK